MSSCEPWQKQRDDDATEQKQQINLQQKHINITDMDINYTAAGCQGAIQLSMLAAYNFNNNVLS